LIRDISERKQAEEKLVKSEAKYRSLVDNSIVGVFESTTDGRFTFANDAMVQMFDFDSPEQMIAHGSLELWNDIQNRERMLAELQKHGRVSNFEAEAVTRTERHIHVLFSAKQIDDRISGMVMDISDRKQAEIELKEAYTEIEQLQIQLQAESAFLQEEIKLEHNFENIIGQSEELKYVLHRVEMVAPQDSTVILLGETGTGKELIARAIHQLSSRNKRPLMKVNCAALPGELIESELFGREKGAFTGATTTQIGRFELADKSTLFLDEIGELPFELQAKLLRVLESGEFERLGSPRMLHSDARIITATNRDLEAEVRKGRFREDLWYRLKIFPITVPPLRDRTEDIPLLVNHFVQLFSRKMGKKAASLKITKSSMRSLQSYPWPGNVRELMHVVESALITSEKNKLHFDLPKTADAATRKLKTFEEMEREYVLEVLKAKNWKIEGRDSASSILGLPPSTLRARIRKLGLKRP
jgi:chemotaxis protein methyltransferase CheR